MNNYWTGKRVRLRGIEPEDAAFFQAWNQDTDVQRNLDHIWFPTTFAQQKQWAHTQSTNYVQKGAYFFVIEELANRHIVGSIATSKCDLQNGNFSYGISIVGSHRRKGYASEAIRLVLDYYFNHLRYHKVCIDIFEYNAASISLHEHLGFRREGQLRSMKYIDGRYYDVFKYGLLKTELLRIKE